MKRYESYKAVDLPWLKEVPSHWEVKKIRHIFEERKEKNVNGKEKFVLSVLKGVGVIPYSKKGSIGNKASENIENYKIVYKDDIVLNSMNMMIGSLGKSNYRGVLSHVYYVLKLIKKEEVDIKYLEYIFKNSIFYESFRVLGKGILDHRLRVPMDALKYEHLPLPSLKEQTQIANYLDWKINDIDKLIAKEKEKIKELENYQKSLISKIIYNVTENSKLVKIKHFANLKNGISESGSFFLEGSPFLSYSDVYDNEFLPISLKGVASSSHEQQLLYSVEKGDIFFTRTSETKGDALSFSLCTKTIEKAIFSGFLIRLRQFNKIFDSKFLYYYLSSTRNKIIGRLNIVTRVSVNQDIIKNLVIKVPSINIQKEAVSQIDTIKEKINFSFIKTNEQIQNLESLKQSLISEVVTGQIDVRDIEIPEYEKFTLEVTEDLEEEVEEND